MVIRIGLFEMMRVWSVMRLRLWNVILDFGLMNWLWLMVLMRLQLMVMMRFWFMAMMRLWSI